MSEETTVQEGGAAQDTPGGDTAAPTQQSDWREALPKEFRDAPYFKGDGKTPEQVLADLENAASWQGNSIRIPGPDATDESRKEFLQKAMDKLPGMMPVPDFDNQAEVFQRMGRPETAADYKSPEGVEVPETLKENAFAANLTQKQFDALIQRELDAARISEETREATQKATEAALKEAWGVATDDRLKDVEALLSASGAPEALKQQFANKNMDADTIKFLYGMVEAGAEKAAVVEKSDGREGRLTPLEARIQAQEIWEQMYALPATDPRYAALKQKRHELVKMYAGQ